MARHAISDGLNFEIFTRRRLRTSLGEVPLAPHSHLLLSRPDFGGNSWGGGKTFRGGGKTFRGGGKTFRGGAGPCSGLVHDFPWEVKA